MKFIHALFLAASLTAHLVIADEQPADPAPPQPSHEGASYPPAVGQDGSVPQYIPEDAPQYTQFVPQDAVQQYVTNYGGASLPVGYGYIPDPSGFSVQSGYDGYLVPSGGNIPPYPVIGASPFRPFWTALFSLPKMALAVFSKIPIFLLGAAIVLLIGGALTTAICTLTPLCTISILGHHLNKHSLKESVRSLITPERISSASLLLKEAVQKYEKMQQTST